MTDTDVTGQTNQRAPYGWAALVFVLVLLGYTLTLAPTVTFWDAGEFIAASWTLGIPHPPGTPLFVLLGHVWAKLLPVGEVAFRLNLMSAVFSAAAAAAFFLATHFTIARLTADLGQDAARRYSLTGALAASLIAAFTFTNWQNSIETEVYAVGTATIGLICWCCYLWRRDRGDVRGARWLVLIVYLGGISMGNHLLALLVGPAVMAFMAATLLQDPHHDPIERRHEWAHLAVIAGVWALLIGTGLGSTTLTLVGVACFLAAAVFAATAHALPFALTTLFIAAVGMTTYLFLYIRAGQQPILNEADPSTWQALLDVIRRAQYPPRTPFDDPTVLSGPGNPGRSLTIMKLQLMNYFQYFSWQWGRAVDSGLLRAIPVVFFTLLGFRGIAAQWKADRPSFWLYLVLWLATGIGLMGYMNFRPGHSIGFDEFPAAADHEVRERDYFFVVSFMVWGLWAGMGLTSLAVAVREKAARLSPLLPAALIAVALVPVATNGAAATRRHGPDTYLAADVAYNLLNSVPPYGILFTYGDNDTFPLWWAQEVEGIRRDVTVVCIALSQTEWYVRQLRDNPVRPFDPANAPEIWRDHQGPVPDWPTHSLTDAEILAAQVPSLVERPLPLRLGPVQVTLPARSALYLADVAALRIIQENLGRRPIAWSVTAGTRYYGLDRYMIQQGLAQRVLTAPPDTTDPAVFPASLTGTTLDLATTERLAWETYRYAGLLEERSRAPDNTNRSFAATLSLPFTQMAYAYESRNDYERAISNLERAARLSPNPAVAAALQQMIFQGPPQAE